MENLINKKLFLIYIFYNVLNLTNFYSIEKNIINLIILMSTKL